MRLKFLSIFLALTRFLSADPAPGSAIDGEPSLLVSDLVDPFTGTCFYHAEDMRVEGFVPIVIERSYGTGNGDHPNTYGGWRFLPHLCLHYHQNIIEDGNEFFIHGGMAIVPERSGGVICYKQCDWRQFEIDFTQHNNGFTNTGKGSISSRTNIKNHRLEFDGRTFTFKAADGGIRVYRYDGKTIPERTKNTDFDFYLMEERLPNGCWYLYSYDRQHRIFEIRSTNPSRTKTFAWVKFHYTNKFKYGMEVEASDGRKIHYETSQNRGLCEVSSTEIPRRRFEYVKHHGVHELSKEILPSGSWFYFQHYAKGLHDLGNDIRITLPSNEDPRSDRVKLIEYPPNLNTSKNLAYRFIYHVKPRGKKEKRDYLSNVSEVLDPESNQTFYYYDDKGKPFSIIQYGQKGHGILYGNWSYAYGSGNPHGDHELTARNVETPYGRTDFSKTFLYDEKGNVLKERLWGNLTGKSLAPLSLDEHRCPIANGCETITTKYAYSSEGLLIRSEEENGLITTYEYLPGMPLLIKKLLWDKDHLIRREFFSYDDDHIPICHIVDDGIDSNPDNLSNVTYRKILRIRPKQQMPACGLPEQINEFTIDKTTGNELLLRKTIIHYDPHGLVNKEEFFDAKGIFSHSLQYRRDEKGRVIEEIDPLGNSKRCAFDCDGLKISEISPSGNIIKNIYDLNGHLVTRSEESSGSFHTSSIVYDSLGLPVRIVDYLGHETSFILDRFGHPLLTVLPNRTSQIGKTFDGLGHELTCIDPLGNIKTTDYNARGKPTYIAFPDGTHQEFLYATNGTLTEIIDQERNRQYFEYDCLGRKTSHTYFDANGQFLKQERFVYDAFHLLEHIDAAGNATHFFYDEAGRKIRESGIQDIVYEYDDNGRLFKKTVGESANLYFYDLLGRIVEEKEETLRGQIISHRKTVYDQEGRVIEKWVWNGDWQIEGACVYDGFGRIVDKIDGCGRVTHIAYDESYIENGKRLLRIITTDPSGLQTIEIKDLSDRSLRIEIIGFLSKRLSLVEYTYDARGCNIRETLTKITPASEHKIITLRTWDSMGRVLSLTEAAGTDKERITRYGYTARGLLAFTQKPDGIIISTAYDALGRALSKHSSDGTIDYSYEYNLLDEVLFIEDHVFQLTSQRAYDSWGRLLNDHLATGSSIDFTYDDLGRRTQVMLPDYSSIAYRYDNNYLTSISRHDPRGLELYAHRYLSYDGLKRVVVSQFPERFGIEKLCYDGCGKLIERKSTFFKQTILKQDPDGNVLEFSSDDIMKIFAYDPLGQLIQEPCHTYSFDNLHNRLEKDTHPYQVDDLNQLLSSSDTGFTYNINGCPLVKNTPDGEIHFIYDALDRLIAVEKTASWRAEYYYDAWHRRLHSVTYTFENGSWKEAKSEYYLWDHDCEIGSCDSSGTIQEFRVLGWGGPSEKNTTVAIELHGQLYIPVHDLFGSIHRILSYGATRIETETYDTTMFGEGVGESSSSNPWRFAGKRYDPLTGFIYFGKRFYCPKEGRWLTPDPRGLSVGINLYAFVRNNSLRFSDAFGEAWEQDNIFKDVVGERDENGAYTQDFLFLTEVVQDVIHLLGMGVTAIGLHFVPDVLGGGVLRHTGDYMQTICEPGLYDRFPHLKDPTFEIDTKSGLIRIPGEKVPKTAHVGVNGMLNRRSDAMKLGRAMSAALGGREVYILYNATHGIFADLYDFAMEKCNIMNHPSSLLSKAINSFLDEFGEGGRIIIFAHSEGGAITKNALLSLNQEKRNMLEVYTFGSASLFDKTLAGSVQHYVATRDPFPFFASPLDYAKAVFANDGSVKFVGDAAGLPEHGMMQGTYWEKFTAIADDKKISYGCPK